MNLYKYLNEKKKFIGACDRIRRKSGGEEFWQDMMKNKKKISEKEFLKNVKIEQLLDDDETWKEWKEIIFPLSFLLPSFSF